MQLVPVDYDPFAQPAKGGPRFEPVDHDPFAEAPAGNLPPGMPGPASPPPSEAGGSGVAFVRGMVNGLPIVGPSIVSGTNKAAALARSLTSGKSYADELKGVEGYIDGARDAHPTATTLGEIGGGVVGTAPLVAAAPAAFGVGAGPLALRAGASAITSGALGAADSAARGQDAVWGGGIGATLGAAMPVAGAGIGKLAALGAQKLAPVVAPTLDDLSGAASRAFSRADRAGVRFDPQAFAGAIDDAAQAMRQSGLDPTLHPRASAALTRMQQAAGTAPMLSETETLRRVAQSAGKSREADEGRLAQMLVDKLDGFVARAGAEALGEGRELWGRFRRAEMIADAVDRAGLKASASGVGANTDNALRQELKGIALDPRKLAGFTEAEQAALREAVSGTRAQNIARTIGRLAPNAGAMQLAANVGAIATDPKLAVVGTAGTLAKMYADGATRRNAEALGAMIRNGGALENPAALAAQERARAIAGRVLGGVPLGASPQLAW